jgi:sulfonate transport system substrate-binding protein
MRHPRRSFAAISVVALGALIVTGCGIRGGLNGGDAQSHVLLIGFPSPTGLTPSGPEAWAYKRGLLIPALKAQGITDVKFVGLPNGPEIDEALASNSIDMGIFGDAPAIVGRADGIPAHVIAISSVGGNCWLVARKDGPNTVEDLRGTTVGVAKGSVMARYLTGLLVERGLAGQVRVVHLLQGDAEAALQRGSIAAYPSTNGPLMELHGFKVIDEAKNHPDLLGTGVTVVTDQFLKAHPGFAVAWDRARVLGIDDIRKHQDEYYQELADKARLPIGIYRKTFPSAVFVTDPMSTHGVALLTGTKQFLLSQHLLRHDFSIDDWLVRPNDTSVAKAN